MKDEEMKQWLTRIERKVEGNTKTVDARLDRMTDDLQKAFREVIDRCHENNRELKILQIEMERQMKRKNLIFYGIKYDSRTKAEEAVKDVIEGNGNTISTISSLSERKKIRLFAFS
jgi:hypothetical protein